MYVKCPAANISHVTQKGLGLKPVMVWVDRMGVEAVTSRVSACTDRGTLIGYVIGISMPDAEI